MGRKQIHRLAARGWSTISYLHQIGEPSSSNWMSSDRRDPPSPKIYRRRSSGLAVIEVEEPAEARAMGDLAIGPVVIRRIDVPDELAANALVESLGHVELDEFGQNSSEDFSDTKGN
jgi:hypothetical protein